MTVATFAGQVANMKTPPKPFLTDDDLRYEYRVMRRWCRLYHKTALDWVRLGAKRFRQRHPVVGLDEPTSRAA